MSDVALGFPNLISISGVPRETSSDSRGLGVSVIMPTATTTAANRPITSPVLVFL